jgi:predicted dehydrogenase
MDYRPFLAKITYFAIMNTTNWGIIGPGRIAKKFAAALDLVDGAKLYAVASRDAAKAADFAAEYGAPTSFGSYEEIASAAGIDAIYVATPHGFHAEHSILCLQKGKAVLCEKPLALSARQVSAMIAASRQSKTFLMEAMWTRFIPLMDSIIKLVASGAIGDLKYIRADFGFLAPFTPRGRLYDMRLGGGSLLALGIFPLFLCTQLLGRPTRIVAAGELSPTGSDTTCHASLFYGDNRSAVITSTLTCATAMTAEIAGTEGMIRIPNSWYKNDRYEYNRTGAPAETVLLEPMVNGFEYQVRETMACMEQGLLESPLLPHSFSLMMAELMDEIRSQIGVVYPSE